jgi:DNA-directed RNA polymerase specialized sigma24 family protein
LVCNSGGVLKPLNAPLLINRLTAEQRLVRIPFLFCAGGITASRRLDLKAEALSHEQISLVYHWIWTACADAGLSRSDAQDVAQDLWLWLLTVNKLALASEKQWLSAVTQNFIRRRYRQLSRQRLREGTPISYDIAFTDQRQRIESNEMLTRFSRVLPEKERRILMLIRAGYTVAEAARALRIPRGSRAYFGDRLVELARRKIGARANHSIPPGELARNSLRVARVKKKGPEKRGPSTR